MITTIGIVWLLGALFVLFYSLLVCRDTMPPIWFSAIVCLLAWPAFFLTALYEAWKNRS